MAVGKRAAGNGSEQDALAALQAHFASSFDAAPIKPVSKEEQVRGDKGKKKAGKRQRDESRSKEYDTSLTDHAPAKAHTFEPESVQSSSSRAPPETIIFGEGSGSATSLSANRTGGWRKFMAAKVDTLKDKADEGSASKRQKQATKRQSGTQEEEEEEEEREMLSNDRALSDLLSTTLFAPGVQDSKHSNGKPNLSSNSTLSRLLELSQPSLTDRPKSVGRGLGTSLLKAQDLGRMPANMRHGMRQAERDRQAKELEKSKELGLYHQSIKGLLGKGAEGSDLVLGTRDKDRKDRTRQKGISMGVGRFAGGTLRLSEQDVQRINGGKASQSRAGGGSKRKR